MNEHKRSGKRPRAEYVVGAQLVLVAGLENSSLEEVGGHALLHRFCTQHLSSIIFQQEATDSRGHKFPKALGHQRAGGSLHLETCLCLKCAALEKNCDKI